MPRAPSSTKLKKASKSSSSSSMRHDPLHAQIHADELTSKFGKVSAPGRRVKGNGGTEEDRIGSEMKVTGIKSGGKDIQGSEFVDPKLSRNILRLAREQQDEIEAEEAQERKGSASSDLRLATREAISLEDSDDDDDNDGKVPASEMDDGELGSDDEKDYEELEIDPRDAELMARYGDDDNNNGLAEGIRGNRTLADMIMEKIEAAEKMNNNGNGIHEKAPRQVEGNSMPMPPGINPKVIEVYTKVGELLSRYKSGPLPKAFKIIPSLPAWENILYITNPATWTPHATLAATRIFVSNLKAAQSQRFFNLVLLDKVRDEIAETGKASYQMYEALKKALFKPAAFFKGFLFPLCETGCTLKEAAMISSVLTRVSIPILHSAAALLHLAEMHYTGANSLFIRVLLDKKYALPYKVVDSLVFHFLRFADPEKGVERMEGGGRRMPVLWHQSLLVFSQRYKQDLTPDQKAALLDLIRVQKHAGISPEVSRELISGKARGELLEEPVDDEEDDAMSM